MMRNLNLGRTNMKHCFGAMCAVGGDAFCWPICAYGTGHCVVTLGKMRAIVG